MPRRDARRGSKLLLDDRIRARSLWAAMRGDYETLVEPMLDRELAKTFFNSLSRRFFRTSGVDADIEFVALDAEPTANIAEPIARNVYSVDGDLRDVCTRMLDDYPFANGYADVAASGAAIADALTERFGIPGGHAIFRIELLRTRILPRAPRVSRRPRAGRARRGRRVVAAARDRARQRRERRARRRGADRDRPGVRAVRLFAQLFPRRSAEHRRCGRVPARR